MCVSNRSTHFARRKIPAEQSQHVGKKCSFTHSHKHTYTWQILLRPFVRYSYVVLSRIQMMTVPCARDSCALKSMIVFVKMVPQMRWTAAVFFQSKQLCVYYIVNFKLKIGLFVRRNFYIISFWRVESSPFICFICSAIWNGS